MMGTKWLEPSERQVSSVLRRSDLGLAALAGAGATLVAVGLLLPVYGPRTLTIEPCSEDGVTLYDGSCGHPSTAHFTDGYWFQGASDSSGTIAPVQIDKTVGSTDRLADDRIEALSSRKGDK